MAENIVRMSKNVGFGFWPLALLPVFSVKCIQQAEQATFGGLLLQPF